MSRRTRTRFGLAVVLVLVVLGCPAAGALPIVGDCKDAPEISRPDAGFGSWIGARPPEQVTDADPFAPDATVSIVDVYGYGGLTVPTYDLGCGGASRDPMASATTMVANSIGVAALMLVAFTAQVSVVAQSQEFLSVFDPILEAIANATRDHLFLALFPLTLLATGILVLVRANRARLSEVMSHAGWVLLVLCAAVFLLGAPLKAAALFDEGLGYATDKVQDTFAANDPDTPINGGPLVSVAPVHEKVLYETWKAQMFGNPDSAAAQKYAADLLRNSTYSWAELERIAGDPDAEQQLREEKQENWKTTAGLIEQEDHDAYVNLQGRNGTNRIWRSVLSVATAFMTCAFVIVAGLMLLAALLVVRVFILGFPLVAILGGVPSKRYAVMRLWDYFTGAIVAAIAMAFAAGVVSMLIGAVLAANTAGILTLFLCGLITTVAWRLTKPFRSLTNLVPGVDKTIRKVMRLGEQATAIATGVSLGRATADHDSDPDELTTGTTALGASRRTDRHVDENHSLDDLPARPPAELPPANPMLEIAAPTITAGPDAGAPSSSSPSPQPTPPSSPPIVDSDLQPVTARPLITHVPARTTEEPSIIHLAPTPRRDVPPPIPALPAPTLESESFDIVETTVELDEHGDEIYVPIEEHR